MKRFLLSAALLVAATSAIQAHTLDGIVKDNKTGEPLIGTVIRVKELPNVSTTTGLDGTFTLHELPDKGKFTIIVSYMSYKTKEMVIDVAKKNKVDIPMNEDLKQLGEVVVTGHREYRSDRSAIETVKNAGNVLNVMSQHQRVLPLPELLMQHRLPYQPSKTWILRGDPSNLKGRCSMGCNGFYHPDLESSRRLPGCSCSACPCLGGWRRKLRPMHHAP